MGGRILNRYFDNSLLERAKPFLKSYLETVHGLDFKNGRAKCPFHGSEKHRPLTLLPDGRGVKCHNCGQFANIFIAIQILERVDFKEAKARAFNFAGIVEPRKLPQKKKPVDAAKLLNPWR